LAREAYGVKVGWRERSGWWALGFSVATKTLREPRPGVSGGSCGDGPARVFKVAVQFRERKFRSRSPKPRPLVVPPFADSSGEEFAPWPCAIREDFCWLVFWPAEFLSEGREDHRLVVPRSLVSLLGFFFGRSAVSVDVIGREFCLRGWGFQPTLLKGQCSPLRVQGPRSRIDPQRPPVGLFMRSRCLMV